MAIDKQIRGMGYDAVDMALRAAELGLQAAIGAVGLVRTGAEAVLGSPQPVPAAREREPVPAEPSPRGRPQPRRAVAPEPPEPEHVDEGVVPVAEFAEPGAEDGAGAEIEVEEPWEGYEEMPVPDIVHALDNASPATLAAVRLYESSHKERRSVIEAADRRLAHVE